MRARARRERRFDELQPFVASAEPPVQPDEHVEAADLVRRIRDALDELDEPYRGVLYARFFEDRTTKEIAERTRVAHGTVRWRVHEGLRRMRSKLDRRCGGRERWWGVALGLGDSSPPTAAPVSKVGGSTMSSTIKIAAVCATVGGGVFAAWTTKEPTVSQSVSARAPDDAPDEVLARTRETRSSSGSPSRRPAFSAARRGSEPTPEPSAATRRQPTLPWDPHTRESRAENEACGAEALAAYNQSLDDPGAHEHLIDAATCFENAGLLGRSLHIYKELEAAFPDGANADFARDEIERIATASLDPDADLETSMGRMCSGPVREALALGEVLPAREYVLAAQCLSEGALVRAALKYRRLAAALPSLEDPEDNAVEMERLEMFEGKLEALLERVEPKGDETVP